MDDRQAGVDSRQAIGSWLSGPRAAAEEMGVDFGYRGERLGLPESGRGSIAPVGRRIGALFIDWMICLLIAYWLFAGGDAQATGNWALGVLLVLSVLTVGTIGSTPGKRIFGLRVIGMDGGRAGFGWVILRSVLLCLMIPPLIWDRDGRGLHDRFSRTVEVRI